MSFFKRFGFYILSFFVHLFLVFVPVGQYISHSNYNIGAVRIFLVTECDRTTHDKFHKKEDKAKEIKNQTIQKIKVVKKNKRKRRDLLKGKIARRIVSPKISKVKILNSYSKTINSFNTKREFKKNVTAMPEHRISPLKGKGEYLQENSNVGYAKRKETFLSVTLPVPVYSVKPTYPYIAKKRGYEGKVILRLLVGKDGKVKKVVVVKSSGYRILDEEASKTLNKWIFEPAKVAGAPVDYWVEIPVVFRRKFY